MIKYFVDKHILLIFELTYCVSKAYDMMMLCENTIRHFGFLLMTSHMKSVYGSYSVPW